MDNTIRMLLELDHSADRRLQESAESCAKMLEDAKRKAAALNEARSHQTSDAIFEYEEQMRADSESRIQQLRSEYNTRLADLEQQFAAKRDALLTSMYAAVFADAEA